MSRTSTLFVFYDSISREHELIPIENGDSVPGLFLPGATSFLNQLEYSPRQGVIDELLKKAGV